MKTRILSLFLAVLMILSTMTMLGISATAETITATEAGNNVLHVTNSNHTDKFWSKVLVNLDSGISNGYIEFDIRTENIESSAWLDLLVEAANGSYKQLTIRQESGKYHFKKEAGSTQFKEVVLGTWHHVKFVIKNNSATVEIDGVPFTSLNGALNAPVTILNFQLSKPGDYDFYVDNVKAVNSDETVVFEQDFDDDTVGSKPSGFDIAVRSGHNLNSTSVLVEREVKDIGNISENFDSTPAGSLPDGFKVSDSESARVENEIKPSNALHVTNSNQTSGFWSKALVNFDSGISNGYIEFDIRTENIGSGAWLDLMLEADNGRYKQLTIQQIDGKYYFEEQANTNQFKEAELGKWHHVKFVIKNNSATVEVDGFSITKLNGGLNAPVTILNFQLSKPGNYDFYIDNVKAVNSDGTVVFEQDFDDDTVGNKPSGFDIAVRSGHNLDSTTVDVVNAVPLLNEQKTLHFIGKSGAGNKAVTATYTFSALKNVDVEFDYTPIAMGSESNCRQGLIVGGAQIGVVNSALRTGDITNSAYNVKSGVKTVTLGKTYRFKLSVSETEGAKLYVDGQLCSGDGDSKLAAVKSVNEFYFYLDHVQNSAAEMKIGNITITKHGTGEVVYSDNFDKMFSGAAPTGWTIGNGNATYLSALIAGTTALPLEDGNVLRIEDNTSSAVVSAAMALDERSKAEITLFYKAEKLADGHVFAVKDANGKNKVVLRAVPVDGETAKLQYQNEKGEYVDIEDSEFNLGEWNKLVLTVYSKYGKADLSFDGVDLGEVYADITVDKFTSFEVGSASVAGTSDTFCIDKVSVKSDKVPNKIPTPSSMNVSKTVAAGGFYSYDIDTVCSGRFTFVLKSSELAGTVLSLANGDILGTRIKIGADGALCYLRDSIWMAFTNAGVIDTDDGNEHIIVLDVPLERNVGYVNVYVDGSLEGTAFYNVSPEKITALRVTAPDANSITVSSVSVTESQGILAIPDDEAKSVSPYYSELISGTRGMYALGDSSGKAAMKYFDGCDLETISFDENYNAIGIDLGSVQPVNTVRIRFNNISYDYLANNKTNTHWGNMYVYVSNDNVNYTRIGSVSRNTVDDGDDAIMSFDFSGIEARYVKVSYNRTKDTEAILIADVDNNAVSATRRITRQWTMAGDIMYSAADTAPASGKMYDVNDITKPVTLVKSSSIGLDFGLISDVEAVELIGNGTEALDASNFAVYSSNDNKTYDKVDVTSVSRDVRNGKSVLRFNFESIKANHLKINVVGDVSVALESAMNGIAAYSSIEAKTSVVHMRSTSDRGSEGGFFTCEDGTLVMCHIEYDAGTHGDDAPAHIAVRRSTDGGVTWSAPVTVVEKVDSTSLNVFVPTFVKLDDGMIGMVFMEKFASYDSSVYIITSKDEGKTWSERKAIAYTEGNIGYFCLSSGTPAYRAPNGRILVSFAYSVYEREAYGSDRCYGYVVYSDDNGETWTRSKNSFTVPEGVMEPAMSATPDGKLIMTMTTRNVGHIYRSISEDNGETWSQPVALQDEFCTSHLTQGHVLIPGTDHMVYICANDQAVANGPKTPLVSAITADNGASYHNIRNLTEGAGGNTQWPVVKIYGRKVIIQSGYNVITVKALDIAEFYHSVTGDNSKLPKASTPTAVYDETTRTLSGVNADTAISLDGGESWIYVGGSSITFEQSLVQTARKILVKNIGNTEYAPSDIQELEAHEFDGDTCTVCGASCAHKWNDGVCEYCGAGCNHIFELSIYTGLYYCTVCGEICSHDWTSSTCSDCGLVCVHDWKHIDGTSTCAICKKTCTNHENLGLDFKCTVCGVDTGKSNSFNEGASFVYDNYFTLEKYHNASVSFDFTVGEAYYDKSTKPTNTSDYHSLLTFIRNNAEYHVFASLWMDQESGKLYLTKGGTSATKICEIEQGVKYGINIDFKPTSGGAYTVTVTKNGTVIGTLNNTFGSFSATQKSASLRFGEGVNAKYLRVKKVAFENIEITTESYVNGVSPSTGKECAHSYNIGGYCAICGVLGDPITFNNGQNGGGNVVDTGKNAQPLTSGEGVYSQNNGEYRQCWDYRDTEGVLLGKNYVVSGRFTFNEFTYDSASKNGQTNLFIWSDGDIGMDYNKFLVLLYADNGKLELGLTSGERMDLELGREYDIRIVVRSIEMSSGVYSNRAEIHVNGELMWIKNFVLNAENGMSIRLGDHVARQAKVKYDVKNDFGIQFLDSTIDYIGSQEKENANYDYDFTYDLRFVFGIDDIYLEDVGVKVEAEMMGGAIYEDASGALISSSSRTVLNNIMANGKICKPGVVGAGYGGYYLALAITEIPLDTSATYVFKLTPYVTYHGGETVFSDNSHKITVSFIGDKMNIGYEK